LAEHFAAPFEVLAAAAASAAPAVDVEAVPEVVAVFPAFGIVAEADVLVAVEVVDFAAAEQVWSASAVADTALMYLQDGFDLQVFAMAELKVFCPFWKE
jgi:hypothetical protein